MHEAQEKIFLSQGFYRSWKSCKVKEVHLPRLDSDGIGLIAWKLLVNENSVLEIRYCRCQSKEIASMIEMINHGTNFIEKQSLCLFN